MTRAIEAGLIVLLAAAAAGSAEPPPGAGSDDTEEAADSEPKIELTPQQVAAFANVRAIAITPIPPVQRERLRIAPDMRRVTKAMLRAAGWRVLPKDVTKARAAVTVLLQTRLRKARHETAEGVQKTVEASVSGELRMVVRGTALVGRLSGAAEEVVTDAPARPADDLLLQAFLRSGFLESLSQTLEALGKGPESRFLAPLLDDPNETVRFVAAGVLGNTGEETAVLPLAGALMDRSAKVRRYAIIALGKLGKPAGVEPLLRVLRKEERGTERQEAIRALRRIGGPAAVPALLRETINARGEEATLLWSEAIVGLGQTAVEPLCAALEDESPSIRRCAATVLADMILRPARFKKSGAPPVPREAFAPAVDAFIASLQDSSPAVRYCAVRGLGGLGDTKAIPALEKVAQEDKDHRIRSAANEAIAELGGAEAVKTDKGPGQEAPSP